MPSTVSVRYHKDWMEKTAVAQRGSAAFAAIGTYKRLPCGVMTKKVMMLAA